MKSRFYIPVNSTLMANKLANKLQVMGVKADDIYGLTKLAHNGGVKKATFWQTTHFFIAMKSGLIIGLSLGLAAFFVKNQFEISFQEWLPVLIEVLLFLSKYEHEWRSIIGVMLFPI